MNHPGALAKKGWHLLRRTRIRVLRRLGFLKGDWNASLPKELQFWDWALANGGRNYHPEEWRNATNPDFELQPELQELIPAPAGAVVRILDVGSGPLTRVGKKWPGRDVQIVPADPLAEEYNALLARHSIRPLVPAVFAHGEKLIERFGRDTFDLAYASNSLDHSCDPVVVIGQMLAVVKPSHYVYLWHVANEGLRERYVGLHQWNFDIRKGAFVVGDGRRTQSVTEALGREAEISCEFQQAFGARIVVAKLRKLAA